MASVASDLKAAFKSPSPYLAWAGLTVFLALSGPFGTASRLPILPRVGYFAVPVAIGIVWGVGLRVIVQSRFSHLSYWTASLVVVCLSALVLAWPMREYAYFMAGAEVRKPHDLPIMAALIVSSGIAIAALRRVLSHDGQAAVTAANDAVADTQSPRLFERLPPDLRGDLVRISGRDHYIDVITSAGQGTLLMRLSDALSELRGIDGLRVHRSHWVAARAVVGSEKTGDRRYLILSDGSKVPISRNYLADVETRGLI
jgi:DNA-binding LytR/AlgR family response regulator